MRNPNKRQRQPAPRRENGAALAIALILLVVLSLIGVQSMRTNLQQERIASGMVDRQLAFQAAETALRRGEAVGPFRSNNAALAVPPAAWAGAGGTEWAADFDERLFDPPVYHVGPPQYIRVGIQLPPEWRYLYPVTSVGFGSQVQEDAGVREGTMVVVQSTVEPPGQ